MSHKLKRYLCPSPICLFLKILLIISFSDLAVMFFLGFIMPVSGLFKEALLDALFLSILSSPFVWWFVIRPLKNIGISEKMQAAAVLDHATEGVITFDEEGMIKYFNPASERLFGYSSREMIGRNLKVLFPDYYDALIEEWIDRFVKSGEATYIGKQFDMLALKKGGVEIPVELSISPWRVEDRVFFSIAIHDITERKKIEETLRRSESSLANAQRIAHLGNWDWDIVADELRWSDEIYRIFGVPPHEFGATYEAFLNSVHPDDREFVKRSVDLAIHERMPYSIDHRIILPDGTERIVHEQAEVLFAEDGRPVRMSGTVQDITEFKRLEGELRQAQKMEAIGQLAGGIAHDFNNILTAIIGYASLLQMKTKEDDPLRNYINQIVAASERGATLTQRLLTFSRKQIFNPVPIDINEIVRGVEKLLIKLIGEDIELNLVLYSPCSSSYNGMEGEIVVMADRGQIDQVLINLVTNARDAMPSGGLLTIRTGIEDLDNDFIRMRGYGDPGRYAFISVTDTGEGMDAKTMEKIFDPFFTTKEVGKGTGLGLSVVYGIVKQHNGYIDVKSEQGRGTTFKVYLPLIKRGAEKTEPADTIDMNALEGGYETVLIVEDEFEVRTLAKDVLSQFGYKVIEAADGAAAVERFKEKRMKIHLVLLDVMIPKKNGREVCKEIKKMDPDVRVLFISGYPIDILQDKGILDVEEAGDIVYKPISPGMLLQKVREALNRWNKTVKA